MKYNLLWIVVLFVVCAMASCQPVRRRQTETADPRGEVISVSVSSSVAVRGQRRAHRPRSRRPSSRAPPATAPLAAASHKIELTEIPPSLEGANFEFIKQLNAKKAAAHNEELPVHPFQLSIKKLELNELDDSVVEGSVKAISSVPLDDRGTEEFSGEVPLARSVPASHSSNNLHDSTRKPFSERRTSPRLTTAVSFNIVHDGTRVTSSYEPTTFDEPKPVNAETTYSKPAKVYNDMPKVYSEPAKVYSDAPKVYSEPAKVYSEPAKVYSEPAKVYSEPAKVYGEPAKVYGEPAKIYSEPAKFYSEPASLHLEQALALPPPSSTTPGRVEPEPSMRPMEHQPEKNYEVDEKVSVKSDGRAHGVQDEACKHDNCKVGYVVEGRQYRKYRVEERTADGYIVGEYGVVRHEDGALRGVRYTADSDASPRLIYDALMKFLQL